MRGSVVSSMVMVTGRPISKARAGVRKYQRRLWRPSLSARKPAQNEPATPPKKAPAASQVAISCSGNWWTRAKNGAIQNDRPYPAIE